MGGYSFGIPLLLSYGFLEMLWHFERWSTIIFHRKISNINWIVSQLNLFSVDASRPSSYRVQTSEIKIYSFANAYYFDLTLRLCKCYFSWVLRNYFPLYTTSLKLILTKPSLLRFLHKLYFPFPFHLHFYLLLREKRVRGRTILEHCNLRKREQAQIPSQQTMRDIINEKGLKNFLGKFR